MAIFDPADDTTPQIDDPTRDVHPWELDQTGARVYEAGFLDGYSVAEAEISRLRAQLAQAEWDADRYYAEMCRRPAPAVVDVVPYAELCRRRGENDRADRAEQHLRNLFAHTA